MHKSSKRKFRRRVRFVDADGRVVISRSTVRGIARHWPCTERRPAEDDAPDVEPVRVNSSEITLPPALRPGSKHPRAG